MKWQQSARKPPVKCQINQNEHDNLHHALQTGAKHQNVMKMKKYWHAVVGRIMVLMSFFSARTKYEFRII